MSDQLFRCRWASGSVDIGPDAFYLPDTVDLTPPASKQLFTERGTMTDRFRRANPPTTELADYFADRDRGLMETVANAGAFVALTDGHLENACVGVPGAR